MCFGQRGPRENCPGSLKEHKIYQCLVNMMPRLEDEQPIQARIMNGMMMAASSGEQNAGASVNASDAGRERLFYYWWKLWSTRL